MKIIIQTPGFKAKPELIGFVHNKSEKLFKFHYEVMSCEVCLEIDNSDINENKRCEIRLSIPGNDLMGGAQRKTFEEAVSKAVEIISGQMKRRKTKIIGIRNGISIHKIITGHEHSKKHA